jgi:hypothetical protein
MSSNPSNIKLVPKKTSMKSKFNYARAHSRIEDANSVNLTNIHPDKINNRSASPPTENKVTKPIY